MPPVQYMRRGFVLIALVQQREPMITSDLEFRECGCRLRHAHRLLGLAGRCVLGLVSGVCHVGGSLGRVGIVARLQGRYPSLGNGLGCG
jgi:hypothetical protein